METKPTLLQRAALWGGGSYVALGIAGFVPGLVTHYSRMTFAGRGSGAQILAVFTVCILLNAAHMGIGLVTLALARDRPNAASAWAGAAGLVLAVYGLAAGRSGLSLDGADNALHAALGVALVSVPLWTRFGR